MRPITANRRRLLGAVALLAALVVVAGACERYHRGPDPTDESIEAETGPFDHASVSVSNPDGFGGGTIWYPDVDEVPEHGFAGIAVAPGFLSGEGTIAWYGPKLASNGFVVVTISTNSIFDGQDSRGEQLLAALDHLTGPSPVADMVDEDRLGVMGWSMGGGGSLYAARERPELRAAVPLAAHHGTKDWSEVITPTLFVSCENDSTASNDSHSIPFYESLEDEVTIEVVIDGEERDVTVTIQKAYLEIDDDTGHDCVTSDATESEQVTISRSVLPWLKRYLDLDQRYEPWICPPPDPSEEPMISDYRSIC